MKVPTAPLNENLNLSSKSGCIYLKQQIHSIVNFLHKNPVNYGIVCISEWGLHERVCALNCMHCFLQYKNMQMDIVIIYAYYRSIDL